MKSEKLSRPAGVERAPRGHFLCGQKVTKEPPEGGCSYFPLPPATYPQRPTERTAVLSFGIFSSGDWAIIKLRSRRCNRRSEVAPCETRRSIFCTLRCGRRLKSASEVWHAWHAMYFCSAAWGHAALRRATTQGRPYKRRETRRRHTWVPPYEKENGLPHQCEHWFAMTGEEKIWGKSDKPFCKIWRF